MPDALKLNRIRKELPGILMTLGLVTVLTVFLFTLVVQAGLTHGSTVYLLPVVIAAIRWGIVPAIVAAVCGVLCSAFFFYPPVSARDMEGGEGSGPAPSTETGIKAH